MIRKLLLLSVFFGLTDVALVSCCKDSILDYTKFMSVKWANSNLKNQLPDSSTVNKDSFRVKLTLDGSFIASSQNHQLFLNSSYALSCETLGLKGLKSDIVRFEVSCNKEIPGTPAGEKIGHEKIKAYEFTFVDDAQNKRHTIAEWINFLNNGRYEQIHYDLFLEFTEEIISTDYLAFKIIIGFEDGSTLESETNHVRVI